MSAAQKPDWAAFTPLMTPSSDAERGPYAFRFYRAPDPGTLPFGTGCSELIVRFRDLDKGFPTRFTRPAAARRPGISRRLRAYWTGSVRFASAPGRSRCPRHDDT